MAKRADDLSNDPVVVIVNPDEDTSVEALEAWIAEITNDEDEWLEVPVSAAELIAQDRAESGS
jgi:hypothetical protein